LCGDIHVPYAGNADESVIYHGAVIASVMQLWRVQGTTKTNISPTFGGVSYGPYKPDQIKTSLANRNYFVFVGINFDGSLCGVWASQDAGNTLRL